MKRRLNLWMLLALVAGFALIFAGFAAASRSPNWHFWFGVLFGSMFGLLVSLPVFVLPWIWNHWARRCGIDTGPRELALSGIVVLVAILIMAALLNLLNDRGRLEWFLNRPACWIGSWIKSDRGLSLLARLGLNFVQQPGPHVTSGKGSL